MVIAVKCWLGCLSSDCKYCFVKRGGWAEKKPRYDLNKVLSTIRRLSKENPDEVITLHGGEPTDLPKKDFVRLLKEIYKLKGRTAMQTNGFNIDSWYIRQFKKYKTSVGLSFDGPDECNLLRGKGDDKERLRMTKKLEKTINRLIEEKIPLSFIIIVHRKNGIENRGRLKYFLSKMAHKGIREGRLNLCCITENIPSKEFELSIPEAIEVYKDLYDFCTRTGLSYSPFKDITNSLLGKKEVVCVFGSCDIFCTPSIKSILHDGTIANCVKTYHEGFPFMRAELYQPQIREQLLLETDCKGCKWWDYCKGGCPNHGIHSDWRRKDKFCPVYKVLFNLIYTDLKSKSLLPSKKCQVPTKQYSGNHSDGIVHSDGPMKHLDSGRSV